MWIPWTPHWVPCVDISYMFTLRTLANGFIWVHLDSSGFILVHLDSSGFIWVHLGSSAASTTNWKSFMNRDRRWAA